MSQMLPVRLLKEGTDTSQGIPQIVSNINACQVIGEAIKTTLGPRGMDKMVIDARAKVSFHFKIFFLIFLVRRTFLTTGLLFYNFWTLFIRPPKL